MAFVVGRGRNVSDGPVCRLGTYRARDGSRGADLALDLDRPHAMLVVGKRGYGKSHTLGVVAEDLARTAGVAPVIVDPMGDFRTLDRPSAGDPVPTTAVSDPAVTAASLDPRSWCSLLGLSPESGAGSLVWRAAATESTLAEMRDRIEASDAPDADRRAATNHVELAASWGVFDPDGLGPDDLCDPEATVVDVSGFDAAPMNAVVRGIAESLYDARVDEAVDRLPWLLLDEAHAFFGGVAAPALETVLTRGRTPGVSLVAATQRPGAVPDVAVSQSDVIVSHRLTAGEDLTALERAQPTYVDGSITDGDRMPTEPGEVLVVDDATETVHAATVRARDTPHGGASPRASELSSGRSAE
ncbi:ATP-binding protein [Halomicrobium salinisoli]|uniref:ATP-binding protein n=1 Tax=Halomicrobium salinisoli TaxID=2878391 RepID=UPI001CF06791|nr:DUF87 domain-containing protein [Halomicrobium salinisoli]